MSGKLPQVTVMVDDLVLTIVSFGEDKMAAEEHQLSLVESLGLGGRIIETSMDKVTRYYFINWM